MVNHDRLALTLVFILVALSSLVTAVTTVIPEEPETPPITSPIPETPYTDGTPFPPDTPSTPESPVIYSDPPLPTPETPPTPFTRDVPVTPPTTEVPCEEDPPGPSPVPQGGCEKPKPYDNACAFCECVEGEWMCMMMDCMQQECVDGYKAPGACCETCPNGPNCGVNDVIIPAGESAISNIGEQCFCEVQDGVPRAFCTPPTPKIPTCEDMPPYAQGPCNYCWCFDGEWMCVGMACAPAPCVDAIQPEDQCCESCPDGPNCEIYGQIIPLDQTVEVAPGEECTCKSGMSYWDPPQVICAPKPPSCTDSSGPSMDMPCGYCWCDENSGGWVCLDRPCYPTLCVDAVKSQDGCCDECPNGYNCEAFGEIIPWGEMRTLFNGMMCACEFNWGWGSSSPLQAQCTHVPEPPMSTPETIIENTSESPPESTTENTPVNTPEDLPEITTERTQESTPESKTEDILMAER